MKNKNIHVNQSILKISLSLGKLLIYISAPLLGIIGGSCTNDIEPLVTDKSTAYVNFYNAAEALVVNKTLLRDNMLYINDSIRSGVFHVFPYFNSNITDKRQYPEYYQSGTPVVPPGVGYDPVLWMPMEAGEYKFIYTSVDKQFLKDTTCLLSGEGSLTSLYLVESPEADNTYKIVVVPEERPNYDGRIRLRVVNLSTDAGSLSFKRVIPGGTSEDQGLPQNMSFGMYSEHVLLDTVGVSLTQNNIPIRVFQNTASGEKELMTVLVPPLPNTAFTLLVQGFTNSTPRRIQTGSNLDGTPAYTRVTVPSNFRIYIRRIN